MAAACRWSDDEEPLLGSEEKTYSVPKSIIIEQEILKLNQKTIISLIDYYQSILPHCSEICYCLVPESISREIALQVHILDEEDEWKILVEKLHPSSKKVVDHISYDIKTSAKGVSMFEYLTHYYPIMQGTLGMLLQTLINLEKYRTLKEIKGQIADFLKKLENVDVENLHRTVVYSLEEGYYKDFLKNQCHDSVFRKHCSSQYWSYFCFSSLPIEDLDKTSTCKLDLFKNILDDNYYLGHSDSLKDISFTTCKVNDSYLQSSLISTNAPIALPKLDDQLSIFLVNSAKNFKEAEYVASILRTSFKIRVSLLGEINYDLRIRGPEAFNITCKEHDFIAPLVTKSFLQEVNSDFCETTIDILDVKYIYRKIFQDFHSARSLNFLCQPLVLKEVKYSEIQFNELLKRGDYLDDLEQYVSRLKKTKEDESYKEFRRHYRGFSFK